MSSIPVLLLACSQDWTCNLKLIVLSEALGTNAYNRYAMCPAGHIVYIKGRSSKFRVSSRVPQISEEGRKTHRPKRCGNNYKDEDNMPKALNDKNHQASQKFRQLISTIVGYLMQNMFSKHIL